jgi:hypothetical protein
VARTNLNSTSEKTIVLSKTSSSSLMKAPLRSDRQFLGGLFFDREQLVQIFIKITYKNATTRSRDSRRKLRNLRNRQARSSLQRKGERETSRVETEQRP